MSITLPIGNSFWPRFSISLVTPPVYVKILISGISTAINPATASNLINPSVSSSLKILNDNPILRSSPSFPSYGTTISLRIHFALPLLSTATDVLFILHIFWKACAHWGVISERILIILSGVEPGFSNSFAKIFPHIICTCSSDTNPAESINLSSHSKLTPDDESKVVPSFALETALSAILFWFFNFLIVFLADKIAISFDSDDIFDFSTSAIYISNARFSIPA